MDNDKKWMQLALDEARKAFNKNEVPIGAVVVCEDKVIGRGHNLVETIQDATAHAEIMAITTASGYLASWRLDDCSIYVTVEPCPMCAGAILLSRIKKLVYGADDPRCGACGSAFQVLGHKNLDFTVVAIGGIMKQECGELMTSFFQKLRLDDKT